SRPSAVMRVSMYWVSRVYSCPVCTYLPLSAMDVSLRRRRGRGTGGWAAKPLTATAGGSVAWDHPGPPEGAAPVTFPLVPLPTAVTIRGGAPTPLDASTLLLAPDELAPVVAA